MLIHGDEFQAVTDRLNDLNWTELNHDLIEHGFTVLKPFLSERHCETLRHFYHNDDLFRSTIDMRRYNFGSGSYRYFCYPLPPLIETLRNDLYQRLCTAANLCWQRLRMGAEFPETFAGFQTVMRAKEQTRPTPLILRYEAGDYNCLHQDLTEGLVFPYQVVVGLSEKGLDYEGGQLILTQQRPRMQTVPHILTIPRGGAVIFASSVHPHLGTRGYYRTIFKHGVGKIERGERYTLGLVFHDYKNK